jgi:hypothetical protein
MTVIINGTDSSATTPALTGGTAGTSTGPYFPATNQWAVATNGTQAMLVDSGQNIFLNTTSATSVANVRGSINWNYSSFIITRNASNAATTKSIEFLYDGDTGGNTTIGGTNAIWSFANGTPTTSSTTSGLQAGLTYGAYYGHRWNVNGTEYMRIDNSGNVGIGTTSPSVKFQVNHSSDVAAIKGSGGGVTLGLSNSSANDVLQRMTNNSNNFWDIRNVSSSSNFVIGYNGNDRMTFDTSGNVMVGTGSLNGTNGFSIAPSTFPYVTLNKTASGGFDAFKFQYNSSGVGSITYTNTAVAFNTSSDYRLKQDIAPMTGALAKVALLKPVTYKWKSDGSDAEGFIAHELAEVCPHAVTGDKDAVDADGNPKYQGIDTSYLVATLTAAIQELKAEFDAYKATHP